MNQKQVKLVRNQIRHVAKENLEAAMSSVTIQEQYTKILHVVNVRLDKIQKDVNAAVKAIDDRQKDIQTFLMNQVQADLASRNPMIGGADEVKSGV